MFIRYTITIVCNADRITKYPMNSIEHIVSDAFLSDKDIETMIKNNISIVPTMTVGQSYLMEEAYDTLPPEYQDDFIYNELKIRKEYFSGEAEKHCTPYFHKVNIDTLEYYKTIGRDKLWENKIFLVNPDIFFGFMKYGRTNLLKMKNAGARIGCGIDAGMPFCYFGGLYREFEIFSRIGFSNDEILRCATINNAEILGMKDDIGSVEKGKYADLVFLKDNPLKKIETCRNPEIVIKEGKLVHSREMLQSQPGQDRLSV